MREQLGGFKQVHELVCLESGDSAKAIDIDCLCHRNRPLGRKTAAAEKRHRRGYWVLMPCVFLIIVEGALRSG